MSKKTKIWLLTAASLILIGGIIFVGVMTMLKWDFTKLSTNKYETNKHEVTENYKNVSIITKTADIELVVSENSKCEVVCYEQKNVKHSVAVKDGTLVIEVVDERKWYHHIGINFGAPKLTVYIPQGEYGALSVKSSTGDINISKDLGFECADITVSTGDVKCHASIAELLKVKTSTGDIGIEDISAGALDLSVTTGKITASDVICGGDIKINVSTGKAYLTDIECKGVTSSGSTGDISLKNVIASEKFSIERDTGDVIFEGCDAAEIFVKTDTGDITGTLLSEKVFIPNSKTGKVEVPKTITGRKCEITTDTGDIRIRIEK